ncbi:MAG TPA: hypothetical protein VFR07_04355 [Mycobacteriales bacterium]|nr:hypothetical protein [Mycobacteriales bacterium]
MREAELFVAAEVMLVEVLGRIREADRALVLPPIRAGDGERTLAQAVADHVRQDLQVTEVLLGAPAGAGPAPVGVGQAAGLACAAARDPRDEGPATRDVLLRATVERSLLAHYVAARLGSTACPLPEELARPLWELTAPDAARWRSQGWFREPMPLPPHVSWRDRFLLCAGHEPHPFGH